MNSPIVFDGEVEWSGENPGISLKERADGPFVALASFFRVVVSPHGRGQVLVLLQSPQDANPPADRGNYCLSDNKALADYVIADFVSHFGAFKGLPGLSKLDTRVIENVTTSDKTPNSYSETIRAPGLNIELAWLGLGRPFCFAVPPGLSATGKHHMPTLFVGCADATITVNGRSLPGKPAPREIAGQKISTAMLAFAETWIRA